MRDFPIAVEGFVYIGVLAVVCVVTYLWRPWVVIIPIILLLFVAFFFRNPARVIPQDPGLIVSPADGVVQRVEKVYEGDYLHAEAQRVSIFLNIFNVHINRTPMQGRVEHLDYRKGKFLPAFQEAASAENEQNRLGISNGSHKIMVTQIAGLIARRVVCWVQPGDEMQRGDRFGLIKFGSCTEVYLPLDIEIEVKKGDQVKGGETIIGRAK
ncbi:MAG: phosphatidylserine decarboxylase family protein [Firmicutes bacterium]|nr:phosphatidylserine decarboxylase family protein [Bacillota bacterium]